MCPLVPYAIPQPFAPVAKEDIIWPVIVLAVLCARQPLLLADSVIGLEQLVQIAKVGII